MLLKRMTSGTRNKMQSFTNHYDIWDAAQTEWRWENEWTIKPKKSTLAGYEPIREYETVCEAKGKQKPAKFNNIMFLQILELWATENPPFRRMLRRYTKATTNKRDRAGNLIPQQALKHWCPPLTQLQLSDAELGWAGTSKRCMVCSTTVRSCNVYCCMSVISVQFVRN